MLRLSASPIVAKCDGNSYLRAWGGWVSIKFYKKLFGFQGKPGERRQGLRPRCSIQGEQQSPAFLHERTIFVEKLQCAEQAMQGQRRRPAVTLRDAAGKLAQVVAARIGEHLQHLGAEGVVRTRNA